MASLTKMMTAIVVLELANELHLDIRSTYFKVSLKASNTTGTTAFLIENQVLSIWDLLHGLMLPSGNDAAMVLAENFAELLILKANRSVRNDKDADVLRTPTASVYVFVKQMNKFARKIHMRATNYANPHGLADKSNHSTAHDLACLANFCMKNETFRQVVNSKTYSSINYLPVKKTKRLPNHQFTKWELYEDRDVPFPHTDIQYV